MRAETPSRVAQWLDELSVTIYHSVPSLFRSVVSAGQVFHHVRVVRLEGDRATRIDLELFRRHFTARSVLAVGLGTTETGLVCQSFDHNSALPEGVVPIGYPVTGMQFEVRGDDAQPVQPGTAGEIVVRSRFLATGYWNNAAATERAFASAGPGSLGTTVQNGKSRPNRRGRPSCRAIIDPTSASLEEDDRVQRDVLELDPVHLSSLAAERQSRVHLAQAGSERRPSETAWPPARPMSSAGARAPRPVLRRSRSGSRGSPPPCRRRDGC